MTTKLRWHRVKTTCGSRCSNLKIVRNMSVVWFLTGMWHGASWNYILWGLYYLLFLLLERFVIKGRMPKVLDHIYTLIVVFFGWVIFRFESLPELGTVFLGLFGVGTSGFTGLEAYTVFMGNIFFLIFACIAVTSLGKNLRKFLFNAGKSNHAVFMLFNITELLVPPLLLFLSVLSLIGASYNPFLYFQF